MKALILTEGSKGIGFGHITRCTALLQAFLERDINPLFVVNGDNTVDDLIQTENYYRLNWLRNPELLFNLVKDTDVVVVDSYFATLDFYNKIYSTVQLLVHFDDFLRIEYPAGIVINGAVFAEELPYKDKRNILYLLGSKYVSIRKEFWHVSQRETKGNIENILLTFGGEDAKNITPLVLKQLTEKYPEVIKTVIIGKGYTNIDEINYLKDKNTNLVFYPSAMELRDHMLNSDLTFCAGGQTLNELARTGSPTFVISVAENQRNNINGWEKLGFIKYLGNYNDADLKGKIINTCAMFDNFSWRKKSCDTGQKSIDGQGCFRIVDEIIKNLHSPNLKVHYGI